MHFVGHIKEPILNFSLEQLNSSRNILTAIRNQTETIMKTGDNTIPVASIIILVSLIIILILLCFGKYKINKRQMNAVQSYWARLNV